MLESMNFPGFFLGVAPADAALGGARADGSHEAQAYLLTLTQPQRGPGEDGEGGHGGKGIRWRGRGRDRCPPSECLMNVIWSSVVTPAGEGEVTDVDKEFCSGHQFMLRKGLDGQKGTASLESVAHPGSFVSALPQLPRPAGASAQNGGGGGGVGGGAEAASGVESEAACMDAVSSACESGAKMGLCISQSELYKVACRSVWSTVEVQINVV